MNLFHQMNKMNTEIKQKWVNALRSGEYEQGSEKLYSGRGYCCLGVLCDLYSKENGLKWEFRGDALWGYYDYAWLSKSSFCRKN